MPNSYTEAPNFLKFLYKFIYLFIYSLLDAPLPTNFAIMVGSGIVTNVNVYSTPTDKKVKMKLQMDTFALLSPGCLCFILILSHFFIVRVIVLIPHP